MGKLLLQTKSFNFLTQFSNIKGIKNHEIRLQDKANPAHAQQEEWRKGLYPDRTSRCYHHHRYFGGDRASFFP